MQLLLSDYTQATNALALFDNHLLFAIERRQPQTKEMGTIAKACDLRATEGRPKSLPSTRFSQTGKAFKTSQAIAPTCLLRVLAVRTFEVFVVESSNRLNRHQLAWNAIHRLNFGSLDIALTGF